MRIWIKLTGWVLASTIFPLSIMGYAVYRGSHAQLLEGITDRLEAVAQVQEGRLNEAVLSYVDSHRLIATRINLRALTAAHLQSGSEADRLALNQELVEAHRSFNGSRRLSIISPNGRVVASTDANQIGADLGNDHALIEAQNKTQVIDLIKNPYNELQVRVAGPILVEGVPVGILEMLVSSSAITQITADYTGLGKSGETELTERTAAEDWRFLTPTRFDSSAALRRVIRRERTDSPIIRAPLGQDELLLDATDYRGVRVFAAVRHINALDWVLAVKIDRDEALAPLNELRRVFALAFVATIFLAVLLSLLAARLFTRQTILLSQTAKKLSAGDYKARARVSTKDEVGDLAGVFNKMADEIQKADNIMQEKVRQRTKELRKKLALIDRLRAEAEAMLSSIGEAVIATDHSGRIIFTNGAFEKLFGKSATDLYTKSISEALEPYTEKNREQAHFFKKHLLDRTRRWSGVLYFKGARDAFFPGHVTLTPIKHDKKTTGFIIVVRDITKEEEVVKAKTEFASTASHQLRTPLSAVRWYTELLIDQAAGKLNKVQREYVEAISVSTRRMANLVNALLIISRIETDQLPVDTKPLHLASVVDEVLDELIPIYTKQEHKVKTDYQKKLPRVMLDKHLFGIVVQNLLSNAFKYTPVRGSIHISVSKVRGGAPLGNHVVTEDSLALAVHDSGIGIPVVHRNRIFEKLFRSDNARMMDPDGSGLGLYISKNIVEFAGGEIWFESEEGKGSTFYVTIPLKGMKKK